MGMAASQARLLSITSRLTNNEFRSQTITNSKLRLATESQNACSEYMDALNSKSFMFMSYNENGDATKVNLTPNVLLSYGDLKNQYALVNNSGQILLNGSDIKNYMNSDNMIEFMIASGVNLTDNPDYAIYSDLCDIISMKLNSINPSGWDENNIDRVQYQNLVAMGDLDLEGFNLSELKNAPRWDFGDKPVMVDLGNEPKISDEIVNWVKVDLGAEPTISQIVDWFNENKSKPPETVTNPAKKEIANFEELTGNHNNATCYGDILKESTEAERVWHMDHNLSALIWGTNGIGIKDGEELESSHSIKNTAGNITVNKERYAKSPKDKSNVVMVNINGTFTFNEASGNLCKVLKENSEYECVKNLINDIKDFYCDMCLYLTNVNDEKYKIDSNQGSVVTEGEIGNISFDDEIDESTGEIKTKGLMSRFNDIQNRLNGLNDAIQNEYDNYDNYYKKFEEYHSQLAKLNEYQKAKKQNEEYDSAIAIWSTNFADFKNKVQEWYYGCKEILEELEEKCEQIEKQITDENDPKYQWYKNLWYRMGEGKKDSKGNVDCGNFQEIDENLINNEEWLQFALEHGVLTIEKAQFNENGSVKYPGMGQYEWVSTIHTNLSDVVQVDNEKAIAIAEAKYKKRITEIENEDKKYDQDLKKLDSEHLALQTEFDSIKEVINKNITERSFKAFS